MEASTTRTKRSRNQHDSPLPDEMLVEIFVRLPAKSVGRFRCVSRSWATTLSSPSFVHHHLQRANKQAAGQLPKLFFTAARYYFHAWQHGGQLEQLTGALPLPQLEPYSVIQVLTKPCHGLVLLRCTDFHGHYVCNPSTGALLLLPDSKIPSKMCERPDSYGNAVSYGLGHSSTTKEYKLVRVFSLLEGDPAAAPTTSCEVFSLDVSAHWRPAAGQPPSFGVTAWSAAVFFNGCLHFLRQEGGSIVTFNVCDETFGSLISPPGQENVRVQLTVLGGCLSFHHSDPQSDGPYHIWLLRDYDEGKWEQLCIEQQFWPNADRILLQSPCLTTLDIYRGHGGKGKIMFATSACEVFTVDLDGGGAPEVIFSPDDTIIGSFQDEDSYHFPVVGLLEESLVSVGRANEEIIFSSPSRKAWSDVLKWLPARSLVPLNLVCRDWHTVIKSDRFMQLHATHANMGKRPQIMFIDPFFRSFDSLESCVLNMPHQPPLAYDESVVCSKPCHGLVVGSYVNPFDNSNWDFICNPVMGYFKRIYLDGPSDCTFFSGRIGLGYDPVKNKHVLVRLTYREKNLNTREYQLVCKVQHLDTSSWCSVSPPPRPVADMPPAYANGKLYWMVDHELGRPRLSQRSEILAFDVGTLAFEVLQGPLCYHSSSMRMSVVELRGELCVWCSNRTTGTIETWRMGGNNGVWSEGYLMELGKFSREYSSEETTALAVEPSDGRILVSTGRALGYYDPKTTALETIYRVGADIPGKFAPVLCHESLVRPYIDKSMSVYFD